MAGSKQFAASKKKSNKARQDGDVAKSREFSAGLASLIGLLAFLLQAPGMARRMLEFYERSFYANRDFLSKDVLVSLQDALLFAGQQILPVVLVTWLAVLLTETVQVGLVFSWESLHWKWSRISFFSGLRRMCGWQEGSDSPLPVGLFYEVTKHLILIVGVGAIAFTMLRKCVVQVAYGQVSGPEEISSALITVLSMICVPIFGAILAVGCLDWLYARLKRSMRLRMDLEELKRELRESEGDPESRSLRKQIHQELLMHGTMEGLRNANVVVLGRRETGD